LIAGTNEEMSQMAATVLLYSLGRALSLR
jgi:hypothetical protein